MNTERVWEFFFPNHCPICDRALPPGKQICKECRHIPRKVRPPFCEKCGKHVKDEGSSLCFDCRRTPREFDRGFSLYEYASVHDSVFAYKTLGRPEYGRYYGRKMAEAYAGIIKQLGVEAIIPIPLHKDRLKARGFNQATILAVEISKVTKVPLLENLLIRPNRTSSQKKLGRGQRQNNMKKAFHIAKNDVKLRTVIIVDDIYTTGNTIGAAAAVLRSVGVERIYFITLATGRGY